MTIVGPYSIATVRASDIERRGCAASKLLQGEKVMAADADYETIRKEVDQLRSDIGELTHTLKAIAADETGAAYERVRQTAQRAQEQVSQTASSVGQEIGERPFTSVLSAFSVGLLIGMLFSRR
jgi:ElaB/YqjD/DUF883 family membrane-anchored ribosome-binding protein